MKEKKNKSKIQEVKNILDKKIEKKSGITLIALIITIIIIIILATVSINMVLGDGGIISQARLAMQMWENASTEEEQSLNELLEEYEQAMNKLTAPIITISGTEGNNDYYTSKVTVTIEAEEGTKATKLIYSVTGSEEIEETTVEETSISFTINEDGTSIVSAYLANDNYTSDTSTQSVSIDVTAPEVTLAVDSYDTETITVTATGTDETSGIYSYEFQISTDNSTWTTAETEESTEETCSYTYSNLEDGTEYYIRVIVTDNAGNTATSEVAEEETETDKLYLYYYGDECEDITGGWSYSYWSYLAGNASSSTTAENSGNYMTLGGAVTSYRDNWGSVGGSAQTSSIAVEDYATVWISLTIEEDTTEGSTGIIYLGESSNFDQVYTSSGNEGTTTTTLCYDISDLDTLALYIRVVLSSGSTGQTTGSFYGNIHAIWLE